jgi:hypothetical protein
VMNWSSRNATCCHSWPRAQRASSPHPFLCRSQAGHFWLWVNSFQPSQHEL